MCYSSRIGGQFVTLGKETNSGSKSGSDLVFFQGRILAFNLNVNQNHEMFHTRETHGPGCVIVATSGRLQGGEGEVWGPERDRSGIGVVGVGARRSQAGVFRRQTAGLDELDWSARGGGGTVIPGERVEQPVGWRYPSRNAEDRRKESAGILLLIVDLKVFSVIFRGWEGLRIVWDVILRLS